MTDRRFAATESAMEGSTSRVLFVVGQLDKGGLERQLYYLLRAIDRDRYRPAVAVWHHVESDVHVARIRSLGVPLYTIPNEATRREKVFAFRQLVAEVRPEVVHSYSFHTNIAASLAVMGTRAVAVGSLRSDFEFAKRGTGPVLGRLCARWPRYQIANSASASMSAERSPSFFRPRRCAAVKNGLDLEAFHPSGMPRLDVPMIVGLGYFLPVKRWDRLVRTARVLKDRGLRFAVALAGGGPLQRELRELICSLGVEDRVSLLGHIDDVAALLAASSLTVLTSDTEGYPNAVMEALACGRPVVAMDVGDIRTLVDDGFTGFVVPAGDEETLAERLATLVLNPALCREMGRRASDKAAREFGLDRLVRETLAAYREAGWRDDSRRAAIGAAWT
jgi:glycosyltransferase involved in cell wall biosynthesis